MTTFLCILGGLILLNFLLIKFSCNDCEKEKKVSNNHQLAADK
ncbi:MULTISPECIES: hypothetical protein [Croceibacter]|jgi:hypothetical protein|nr:MULTISPECIES: hypothetical protein [Croceibacter]